MLTVVTGGPESRRTEYLLTRLKKRAEQKKKGILLVPESFSHQAERRLLSFCGNPAGQYVTVSTFRKLTEDVLEAVGERPETLDDGGRVLTMHRALTQTASALEYYRGAGRPQLTEKLVEIASELQVCGVSPQQLLELDNIPPKLKDLALIYARYKALCDGGKLDPSSKIDLAGERLEESGLMRDTAVFIDGFEGFTAQNLRFLDRVFSACEEATALLVMGKDDLLYTEQHQTLHRLARMAESHGMGFSRIELPDEPDDRAPALRGLSARLFRSGEEPASSGGGAALYRCGYPDGECELVAALVRQRALEGVRLRDMAVVCGSLEEYGPSLSAAFERYEIPLFLSEKTDLLQKQPIAAALGALEAMEDGFSLESVLDWLRCGLTPLRRDELDLLENYCYTWQVRGGKWFEPFVSPTCGFGNPAPDEGERLENVERIRGIVSEMLTALRDSMKDCPDGAAYASAMRIFLEHIGLEQALEERCKAFTLSGKERESSETAQLWHILTDALDQFSGAMEGVPMDRSEFLRLLKLMLRQYDVSAIPPSLDSVPASEFQRFSGDGAKEIFILGARDGLFPPDRPAASLLTEQERDDLAQQGVELTQNALERAWQQQCAVCRSVAAARDALTVTAPRRLSDGTPAPESYLFRRIASLTGSEVRDGDSVLARLRLTARRPLLQMACRAAQGGAAEEQLAALRDRMEDPSDRARILELRRYASSDRGPITDPDLVRGLYGGRLSMTASRIETVSTCRFSYFMQYGLKAKPRRVARFGAPEIGTFVHYVVEHAVRELCGDPEGSPEAITVKYVNLYWREELPAAWRTARFQAIYDQAGRMACRIVRNVWEEISAGDFRPVCFELDFSQNGDLPPLLLQEDGAVLTVNGKIDRVDGFIRGDTLYLKVLDYKTGIKTFHLSDVLYGLNLQMFLYLLMLEKGDREKLKALTGAESVSVFEPCAALYIPAKSPFLPGDPREGEAAIQSKMDKELRRIGIVRGDGDLLEAMEHGGAFRFLPVSVKKDGSFSAASSVASAEQMGRLIRKTESILRRIASQISRGDVEANPYRVGYDQTSCRFCDYKDACHFDPTMKKDKFRFLPVRSPAKVHEILEQEEHDSAERGRRQ